MDEERNDHIDDATVSQKQPGGWRWLLEDYKQIEDAVNQYKAPQHCPIP